MQSGITPDGTAYDLCGPQGAPVIALIHGLGLSRQVWREHVPQLNNRYRVLNYDLYGHGESAPSPHTATLSVYAEQLATLLALLSLPPAIVIGFSIGGMINRRFALDYPDKVTALVILNSPHDRGEQAQSQVEARAAKVRDQGTMSTLDDALKRWFTPECLATCSAMADSADHSSTNAVQLVRQWREMVDTESYAQAAWVLANGVRELIQPTPSINKPALVMTCENDTGSTPAMSHAIAAEISGAKTIIVAQLQHLGLMENATAFTQPILDFLDEQLT